MPRVLRFSCGLRAFRSSCADAGVDWWLNFSEVMWGARLEGNVLVYRGQGLVLAVLHVYTFMVEVSAVYRSG